MNRKTILFTITLIAMMLLAGAVTLPTVGGSADAGGSRESRATAIDGEYKDDFDNTDNLTLTGDVNLVDGDLLVDRTVIRDEFDRFPLAPWQAIEGNPRIAGGFLLTNGTPVVGATAEISIDLHDMEMFMQLSPGMMSIGGPRIILAAPDDDLLWCTYNISLNEIELWWTNSTGDYNLDTDSAHLMQDEWYAVTIDINGAAISFRVGSGFVTAIKPIEGNFSALRLSSGPTDSAAWDNVTVRRMGGKGAALTDPVNLPVDTFWYNIYVDFVKDTGTTLLISVINPSTGRAYQGFDGLTHNFIILEEDLDPLTDGALRLRLEFTAVGKATPKVFSWKVTWRGDKPYNEKPIPSIDLMEDLAENDLIDLREHFNDGFTDDDNLTFNVAWTSEPQHVLPVVDGHMLSFQLPTKDWFGSETYRIGCSDGTLSVESFDATVVVSPVDDPPLVRPFNRIDMYEDEEHLFNITPYLEDVDTPVEAIKVRALSDNIEVIGQILVLNYNAGGTDRVELEISDYSSFVLYYMDVMIREIDDPPVFDPLDMIAMYEDRERTVNISEFLYDEDDPIEELMIDIENSDRYISLEGTLIILFYPDTGGEFEYSILVSDGNSTVSQVLEVFVQEVNDPPVILTVGGMVPNVDNEVSVSLEEGNTSELFIEVVDEETTKFQYILVSDLDGAYIVGSTLMVTAEVGEIGSYRLQVSISDGEAAALVYVAIEVLNRNDPVQDVAISEPINGTFILEGTLITLKGYAFDPDFAFNQILTYTWKSDLDGPLGTGKTLEEVNLTRGDHTINLLVSDGEYTGEANVSIIITKRGGGGGPNDNGDNGGGVGGSGISTGLIIGIVLAIVVGIVIFAVVRVKNMGNPNYIAYDDPPEEEEPVPSAAGRPKAKPGPAGAPKKAPGTPIDEGKALYGEDYQASEEPEPTSTPAPITPEVEPSKGVTGVAVDTASLAEADPEQLRLDQLKREYQAAISSLPFGVPSSDLAGMDWYELAGAMAIGEHKVLADGQKVVKIGDHWYYSNTEDMSNFLKRYK